jgi:membrane fusion protein (multidrug efflux system)
MAEPKFGAAQEADEHTGRTNIDALSSVTSLGKFAHDDPPRNDKNRIIIASLFIALLGVLLFGPVRSFITSRVNFEITDDAYVYARTSTIAAKIGGVVNEVLFEDNATVKKGDILVKLDTREYENTIKQLEAELSAAKAMFDSAKKELDRGEFDNVVKRRQSELESVQTQTGEAKEDLDRGEFDTIIKRRQSELDSARALLQEAKRELDRGEFDTVVKRRQSELDSATALLDEAKKSLSRTAELQKKGLISEKEFETAQANYQNNLGKRGALVVQLKEAQLGGEKARDTAVAAYQNNLGKVGALEIQLKEAQLAAQKGKSSAVANYQSSLSKQQAYQVQLREALNAAEHARDAATANYHTTLAKSWSIQAQLEQAKLNLEYAVIRAPADGVLGNRKVEPGMVIKPIQMITTFVSLSDRWIVANFKETQMTNIRVGQEVEVEIDAIDGHTFQGVMQSVSPGSGATFALIPPDNATGNFTKVIQRVPTKIVISPESLRGYESSFIPGISANVKVRIQRRN